MPHTVTWIRGPPLEVRETGSFFDPPVGENTLDAYRVGWVAVGRADDGAYAVEGNERTMQDFRINISGVLNYYGARPHDDVVLRIFDQRGRPVSTRYITRLELQNAEWGRMRVVARRPRGPPCGCDQVHVKPYRRRA